MSNIRSEFDRFVAETKPNCSKYWCTTCGGWAASAKQWLAKLHKNQLRNLFAEANNIGFIPGDFHHDPMPQGFCYRDPNLSMFGFFAVQAFKMLSHHDKQEIIYAWLLSHADMSSWLFDALSYHFVSIGEHGSAQDDWLEIALNRITTDDDKDLAETLRIKFRRFYAERMGIAT